MSAPTVYYRSLASPIGALLLAGDGQALRRLAFVREGLLQPDDSWSPDAGGTLDGICRELDAYFAGRLTRFGTAVAPEGTPFQQAVWSELVRLGWGEATSYGALAAAVGRPGSARAIGGAVGANPVPIIVGCHRVLASDGRITGYSGGDGIPTKLWLLAHEHIGFAA